MLENLRKLRMDSGVTQKQLADAIGVSQQSINKYENHNIEPDIETMKRLAAFFHTSIDFLVGYTENAPKIPAEELLLLDQYHRLSKRQQNCVREIIQTYLE